MSEYMHWNKKFDDAIINENYIEAKFARKRLNTLTNRINKIL